MQAKVHVINPNLPISDQVYYEALTANEILFVFSLPKPIFLKLGDILEIDQFGLDNPQTIKNLTSGHDFQVVIKSNNVHDLRLPGGHGTSRFPAIGRFKDN